jgi:hypothetical protein
MRIDKNIPIPRKYARNNKWQATADKMRAGDSVLVGSASERAAIINALKAQGKSATSRQWENGFRVWVVQND